MQSSIDEILSSYDDRAPLAQASTIPGSWYTDSRIAELERLNVFSKTWQLIARTDQVQTPGQFISTTVAGEPVVIVRGNDNVLRAFYNVCSHHAAAVVTQPCGSASLLRCPYHGWNYGLDGSLKGMPEFEGVENFDRADDRRRADDQRDRLARMFSALSATNEAIMRARTREELFDLVCAAAVSGGKFSSTVIALAEPGSDFLRIAATAGPTAEMSRTLRLAVTEARPEGQGLSGTAFRTRQPCISNDYASDKRAAAFHDRARTRGAKSCAAMPLLAYGKSVGVLLFISTEEGAFTPELVALLQRLAENVSFALENFDRADDRRLADEQRERLSRMFVALSATNEAIMRARTRSELFQLVCEAAVHGGKFASTIVGLSEPGSDIMRIVAWAGPKADMQKSVRLAITEATPEGCGMSGTAF